jgi:hypothetical protein
LKIWQFENERDQPLIIAHHGINHPHINTAKLRKIPVEILNLLVNDIKIHKFAI